MRSNTLQERAQLGPKNRKPGLSYVDGQNIIMFLQTHKKKALPNYSTNLSYSCDLFWSQTGKCEWTILGGG